MQTTVRGEERRKFARSVEGTKRGVGRGSANRSKPISCLTRVYRDTDVEFIEGA